MLCDVAGPWLPFRKMLTAISESVGTASVTASLTISAPGGMVTEEVPLNDTRRSVPATIAAPALRIATCAASMTSGGVPNAFDSRSRSRRPPMLVWTMFLTLRLLKSVARNPVCGLALQVPLQFAVDRLEISGPAQGPGRGPRQHERAAGREGAE